MSLTQPAESGSQSPSTQLWEPYPAEAQFSAVAPPAATVAFHGTYASTPPRPRVSFATSVRLAMKNALVFHGRASASEFWWPALVLVVGHLTIGNLGDRLGDHFEAMATAGTVGVGAVLGLVVALLCAIFMLVLTVPVVSAGVRRLHDTDKSGWFLLLGMIPVVGWIITAVMLAQRPEKDGGRYDRPDRAPFDPEDL